MRLKSIFHSRCQLNYTPEARNWRLHILPRFTDCPEFVLYFGLHYTVYIAIFFIKDIAKMTNFSTFIGSECIIDFIYISEYIHKACTLA